MTPPATTERSKHHRFPGEIISHGVWLGPPGAMGGFFTARKHRRRHARADHRPYHAIQQAHTRKGTREVSRVMRPCPTLWAHCTTFSCASYRLKACQLELTVNFRSDAPGRPTRRSPSLARRTSGSPVDRETWSMSLPPAVWRRIGQRNGRVMPSPTQTAARLF
jgi:hypothetical protein